MTFTVTFLLFLSNWPWSKNNNLRSAVLPVQDQRSINATIACYTRGSLGELSPLLRYSLWHLKPSQGAAQGTRPSTALPRLSTFSFASLLLQDFLYSFVLWKPSQTAKTAEDQFSGAWEQLEWRKHVHLGPEVIPQPIPSDENISFHPTCADMKIRENPPSQKRIKLGFSAALEAHQNKTNS